MSDGRPASSRYPLFSPLFSVLLLRFPVLMAGHFNMFFKGTYVLTWIAVWLMREQLARYNIGTETVILLAVGPWVEMVCVKASGLYPGGWPL